MNVHLTRSSKNRKTGPIPVSTSSKDTCPSNCPLKSNGCYAKAGPISIHWEKVTNGERGYDWEQFCAEIKELPRGQLWRHNQAGDLPHDIFGMDRPRISNLVFANKGRNGFTYTHHDVASGSEESEANKRIVKHANKEGFTINLSADNPEMADVLADLDIGPVVTLLPQDILDAPRYTPKGRSIIICPAIDSDTITCSTCELCAYPKRMAVVGFISTTPGANAVCCSGRYGV